MSNYNPTQRNHTQRLAVIGLLAALVFVSSLISFDIPLAGGDSTRIHLGNTFCLLAGLISGPVGGGLAAGIGSFLFDLMNPKYIASAPFTFLFKFAMGFLCGLIAYAHNRKGERLSRNIIAALTGSFSYVILYLGKGFIENMLYGQSMEANLAIIGTKALASITNAIIAVVIVIPLSIALRTALKRAHIWERIH